MSSEETHVVVPQLTTAVPHEVEAMIWEMTSEERKVQVQVRSAKTIPKAVFTFLMIPRKDMIRLQQDHPTIRPFLEHWNSGLRPLHRAVDKEDKGCSLCGTTCVRRTDCCTRRPSSMGSRFFSFSYQKP